MYFKGKWRSTARKDPLSGCIDGFRIHSKGGVMKKLSIVLAAMLVLAQLHRQTRNRRRPPPCTSRPFPQRSFPLPTIC